MTEKKKVKSPQPQQLLVEGKNDQHIIWALCHKYNIQETFSVELPDSSEIGEEKGVETILKILPNKLKENNLITLGIVVDADQDLPTRWQSIRDRLNKVGYQNIPNSPPPKGLILEEKEFPKVGVWLMPNNQLPGMIEDFVAYLIPDDDDLHQKAESILQEIEQDNLNLYSPIHHPKALIHTWLAWQKKPGMPMGQAITAQVLNNNQDIINNFISWLNQLFAN